MICVCTRARTHISKTWPTLPCKVGATFQKQPYCIQALSPQTPDMCAHTHTSNTFFLLECRPSRHQGILVSVCDTVFLFPPTVLRGKPTHSRMSPFKAPEDSDMCAHTHTSNTFFGAKRMWPLKSPEDSCITVKLFLSVFLRWRTPNFITVSIQIQCSFFFFPYWEKSGRAKIELSNTL